MQHCDPDLVRSLRANFERVKTLLYTESKNDPETEPYKSKYLAQSLLERMKDAVLEARNTDESILCVILLYTGIISVETEDMPKAEETFTEALERIHNSHISLKPEGVLVNLGVLNQMGLLWCHRGDNKKSLEYLQRAEKVYADYKDTCVEPAIEISDLFGATKEEEEQNSLETLHTLTLYYLAQVHGQLGNTTQSSVYCHTTLKRQLDHRGKDFDAIDWALNSATLAQFFMEKNAFSEARHHLAAASMVLAEYETSLMQDKCNEEEMEAKKERLNHRGADVARCWAKYDIMLLTASKDRLMENSEDGSNSKNIPVELLGLKFASIDVTQYEASVDSYILTFDDAKVVFLDGQKWLKEASEYYSLEDHASDNIQVVRDMSQLYKCLIFFEDDEERQAKMHKRRLDLLQGLVNLINPQFYQAACRQIWFEIGEIESSILDIKLSRLENPSELPTPQALQKVNRVIEQAISAFNQFLDTFKDVRTREMPKVFPTDLETQAILAYFYIGRLYNRLITPDKAKKLSNIKNSINYFQMVVDYCEKNEKAKEEMATEFNISQDMANLLTLKLTKLTDDK